MAVPDLDFLSALGEEFCGALLPPVPGDLIVPHDGHGVWTRSFGPTRRRPRRRRGGAAAGRVRRVFRVPGGVGRGGVVSRVPHARPMAGPGRRTRRCT